MNIISRSNILPITDSDIFSLRLQIFRLFNSQSKLMDSGKRQDGGIQLLLSAEQEAQQIITAARNYKIARLRQARENAEKEVADFRAEMELQFKKKVEQSSGDSGKNVMRLDRETDTNIKHLRSDASRASNDVVDMLLKRVITTKH
ncbi:V-type proton ATPase subunit G [Zostera marina]|uniref:V-type proton ATPase subunit G n=1 Tax=Zostera marina TaxID=29655 RepID=A0A0K9PIT7_ZOSMR|nr:V-type proton ATPase subunit G [Zostera marina]